MYNKGTAVQNWNVQTFEIFDLDNRVVVHIYNFYKQS